MCKTEKFFVSSIKERLEGISIDLQYLVDNNQSAANKDKLIWAQAKINDLSRLLNTIKNS